MPCNKRQPGSGCAAIAGHSRSHAILGGSEACIATHPSDMAVALRALDAIVEVTGMTGSRDIPIADLHRLPGTTPHLETSLAPGELVVAVRLPAPLGGTQLYRKVRARASYAFADVSVALVAGEGGRPLRLTFGGLAPKPWRVDTSDGTTAAGDIADAVLAGAQTTTHNAYKVPLTRRVIAAALADARRLGASS